jgi:transposase, IS5 family
MGGKQLVFSDYEITTAKKQTKREKFLSEMEVVVPWQALIELIEPHYPKISKKGGRPPYPLATMLRVHLLQQWYLSRVNPLGRRPTSLSPDSGV